MDDYRVATSWRTHPKRLLLEAKIGRDGVLAMMDLWGFCAQSKPDGDLAGMSNLAISVAAGWPRTPDEFINALTDDEIKLLDGELGAYKIHDLIDHNPWIATSFERKLGAQKAAHARWSKEGRIHAETQWCTANCNTVSPEMRQDAGRIIRNAERNAPTPLPSPTPTPLPSPLPSPRSKQLSASDGEPSGAISIRSVFDHYRQAHPRAHKKPQAKSKEWKAIKERLGEGYSVEDLCHAIDGIHRTPHNLGQNDRNQTFLGLELTMRSSDQVTRFIENRERFAHGSEASIKAGLSTKTRKTTEAFQRFLNRDKKERPPK